MSEISISTPHHQLKAQNNLGLALMDEAQYSQGTEKLRLLADAVAAFRAALEVWTPTGFPDLNLSATSNLSDAEKALKDFRLD